MRQQKACDKNLCAAPTGLNAGDTADGTAAGGWDGIFQTGVRVEWPLKIAVSFPKHNSKTVYV